MNRSPRSSAIGRAAWRGVYVLAAVLLGACSTLQFSYNNADSLIRYMAWDYFDLATDQSDALMQRFSQLREWHRAKEIPQYVDLLESAGKRLGKGLVRADVEWAVMAARGHYASLAGRAARDAAPVLVSLDARQIGELEKKLTKEDANYVERWMAGDAKRRDRRRAERLIDRIEEWTGSLDAAQQLRIERFVAAQSRIYDLRLEERRRWQRAAVGALKQFRNADELGHALFRLVAEPEAGRAEAVSRAFKQWETEFIVLMMELHDSLSTEQRARALRRIDRYAEDFRALNRRTR